MKRNNLSRYFFPLAIVLMLPVAAVQAQGVWEKVNVKDEMPREAEIKKKMKSYSFMAKTGENFLTYDMSYYSDPLRKSFKYIGTLSWAWSSQKGYGTLVPGEVVTVKATVSNNSAEPTGSVAGWISYGNWGFTKPVPAKPDFAGPNSSIKLEGSFTVAKKPALNKDGTINPYLTIRFEVSGGNDTRFIRRIITYKWTATQVPPPPEQPPVVAPPPAADANAPFIGAEKTSYKKGEQVVVRFRNLPGFAKDWIGIYGSKAYHANEFIEWKYTNGLKEGTMTFTSPRYGPGEYMFRVYENNGYKLLAQSVVFTVTE